MTNDATHDRASFEQQGTEFLKANLGGESEYNYAANRPPLSYALAGRILTTVLEDGAVRVRHRFTEQQVEWEMITGPSAGDHDIRPYEAFELAENVFFVSFLARDHESIAMAVDLLSGAVTIIQGLIEDKDIVSRVLKGRVEEVGTSGPVGHPPFSLGGTRLLNEYAHNVAYEHIYLTGVYETWLGVRGPQAGQADTEEYRSFKIRDGVYLLYWNEKILTTQMTFLFNFFQGQCVGQVFALVEGQRVHNTIGARTRLIHTKLSELPDVLHLDVYSGV